MHFILFLVIVTKKYQAGISNVGNESPEDVLREITNYQSFECECHLRRISKYWQESIDQGREYGDAERVDRIIFILSMATQQQSLLKLNESIYEIKSIVQGLQNKSRNYDTFPIKYYQALPKIFYHIKALSPLIPNEDKKKLLAALQLNVPEYEMKCFPLYYYQEINTLLKVSRVLLIEYYFPNQYLELNGNKLGKEFIWMCLFTYNTLMDRLYFNASVRRGNAEYKYSDLVIPLNEGLLTRMKQRLITEFEKESFDISQFFKDIRIGNIANEIVVKSETIDVSMKMNICASRVFEESLFALLDLFDKHEFVMVTRSDKIGEEFIDHCPPDSNLSIHITQNF